MFTDADVRRAKRVAGHKLFQAGQCVPGSEQFRECAHRAWFAESMAVWVEEMRDLERLGFDE